MLPSSKTNLQLIVVVFAQFAGTSLWFAGNAILPELQTLLKTTEFTSWITSAVQIGFISGTLLYALLAIPDRFRATHVFLVSVSLAAAANLIWLFLPIQPVTILVSRFLTGFFLAGVYPVGMKIAADRFKPILGKAMGFLVGALVIGTAFPHLIRGLGSNLPYRSLLLAVSALAISGGILLYGLVPASSIQPSKNRFRFQALHALFQRSAFRPAMLGYFGHMWELYTLWAFFPALIIYYQQQHSEAIIATSLWAFGAIGAGSLGCIGGGFLALRMGSARVARSLLITSGLCILLLPFLLKAPVAVFGLFLFVWGSSAAGDSPQFSTLVASHATLENRGSILTLVTCLGFLITVISIQFMAWLVTQIGLSGWLFYILLPGPMLGVLAMRKEKK
ncbi:MULTISPECIES: MFS transporter [unclassified Spirosoma]|uniref:MFS transporter n=1 Tax=unclassified Spirosoma TaxID=2621999 RepID=UPI00095BC26D|nr:MULTISPECIES: MFS transporter [unclassified Spirosoma]MBN8825881.1 MFS transporter [Spirosoma sp.]OJW70571.1 MAG: MFS transporter [Spirosoma sp. 48-14]